MKNTCLYDGVSHIPSASFLSFILIILVTALAIMVLQMIYLHRSKEAKETVDRVNTLLKTDQLTGLLNKNAFTLAARESLDKHPKSNWFILDFDIDHFEHFNAIYGFERGNETLRRMAGITQDMCSRSGELCTRIHADHFACLMTAEDLTRLKERVHNINIAFRGIVENNAIMLSYGIYEITDNEMDVSVMCDRALFAKRTVKGNYESIIARYDQLLHQRQIEDSELSAYMDTALANGEFVAYYQPKYDIRTECIVGVEALVRWRHPKGMLLFPDRFVGLFEKNRQIVKLDLYLLEIVCKKLRQQMDRDFPPLPVSVNFSRNHLYDDKFLNRLMDIVNANRIPSSMIEIELTESAFFENEERLLSVIQSLHQAGFFVSLDDFGSGFSSLNMLKDMSFDIVKLDRGFLLSSASSQRGKIVIHSILELAGKLNLKTVAEGVEHREQLDFLKQCGCDMAQGFYFSKPLPESEYDKLLTCKKENVRS